MSSRYGDRPPPRSYRDLDRDRGSSRRSVSPSRRGNGHEDRDGRRYDRRSPPREYRKEAATATATSSHYDNRHVRRDDRYSHREPYSRKREPSPPTRQARRDEEERKQKLQKEREEEKAASIAASKAKQEEAEEGALNGEDDEQDDMMKAMGFGGFGTTKGKKVQGNQTGTAEVRKERTWRQYMQRKGGFNRPLSPVRKG